MNVRSVDDWSRIFDLLGIAKCKYDRRSFLSLEPVVGAVHELPLPQVSYINSAMPSIDSWQSCDRMDRQLRSAKLL
jgi:hypothetical protein